MTKRQRRRSGGDKGTESDLQRRAGGDLTRRHLRIGWWSLLAFLTLGLVLESMHGFKLQWYVGVDNATRRLMWTLGHAHGSLLALVHLAYAAAVATIGDRFTSFRRTSSWCLTIGGLLLPIGFLLGGIVIYDGDPGLGVLLVPIGGAFLFVAVAATALAVERAEPTSRPSAMPANDD